MIKTLIQNGGHQAMSRSKESRCVWKFLQMLGGRDRAGWETPCGGCLPLHRERDDTLKKKTSLPIFPSLSRQ